MQEGDTGVRSCVGRLQPLVSSLLHVRMDQAEQSVSLVSTGMVYSANGQMNLWMGSLIILLRLNYTYNCMFVGTHRGGH